MEFIIRVIVLAAAVCIPVKCYTDGNYKTKCLEMHGELEQKGQEFICHTK